MANQLIKERTCYFHRWRHCSDADENEEMEVYRQERLFPFPGQDEMLEEEEVGHLSVGFVRQPFFAQSSFFQINNSERKAEHAKLKSECLHLGNYRSAARSTRYRKGEKNNVRTTYAVPSGMPSAYSSRRSRT